MEVLVSLKKLAKGNAKGDTHNKVLGWAIDTVNQVITLPQAIR